MAIDWSNERYCRLYRVTADHAALCWQARAIWPLMILEADGAGLIGTTKGARGVAAAIAMPLEVVEPGLAELVEDGCVLAIATGYVIRNYVEAQTAVSSGNQRVARHRDRERAKAALAEVTSRPVTPGNAEKRDVTQAVPTVTPSRAEPSRADSLSGVARDPSPPAPAPAPAPVAAFATAAVHVALAVELLNAARLEIDPAARPVDFDQGDEMALVGHLRSLPDADRAQAIRHGVAAIALAVREGREQLTALRPGELVGPRSWRKWQAAPTTTSARGRDGPGGRAPPRKTGVSAGFAVLARIQAEATEPDP